MSAPVTRTGDRLQCLPAIPTTVERPYQWPDCVVASPPRWATSVVQRMGFPAAGYLASVPDRADLETEPSSDESEAGPPVGIAEPETLVDGAEGKADTASRLSMESSDPPASWAGPDTPPTNKQR